MKIQNGVPGLHLDRAGLYRNPRHLHRHAHTCASMSSRVTTGPSGKQATHVTTWKHPTVVTVMVARASRRRMGSWRGPNGVRVQSRVARAYKAAALLGLPKLAREQE